MNRSWVTASSADHVCTVHIGVGTRTKRSFLVAPDGFYWGHQCSLSLTPGDSMQVANTNCFFSITFLSNQSVRLLHKFKRVANLDWRDFAEKISAKISNKNYNPRRAINLFAIVVHTLTVFYFHFCLYIFNTYLKTGSPYTANLDVTCDRQLPVAFLQGNRKYFYSFSITFYSFSISFYSFSKTFYSFSKTFYIFLFLFYIFLYLFYIFLFFFYIILFRFYIIIFLFCIFLFLFYVFSITFYSFSISFYSFSISFYTYPLLAIPSPPEMASFSLQINLSELLQRKWAKG